MATPPISAPPSTSSPLAQEYIAARTLFDQEHFVYCIAAHKERLERESLSRYLEIRTLILCAAATEDWYEAEEGRRLAESL